MQKLYCYVDETGQDTAGRIFIVTIVVVGDDRDELLQLCEEIEEKTGKGIRKWHRAKPELRLAYLRAIFKEKRFKGTLFYSVFQDTKDYDLATILSIAKAVRRKVPAERYRLLVYIDGLEKSKRQYYRNQLRGLGVSPKNVQGVRRDESNALTRLADMVAGLLRDGLEGEYQELVNLYRRGKRQGFLVEV